MIPERDTPKSVSMAYVTPSVLWSRSNKNSSPVLPHKTISYHF